METALNTSLRNMDDQAAAYDASCKRVLAEKSILAWIMKTAVVEFRDCAVKEIAEKYIEGTPQIGEAAVLPDESNRLPVTGGEDATATEGTVTYDIRFTALVPGSGERIRLIINVEAQNDFYPGYPLVKRGLYYCSRLISAQYGSEFTNAHYEKIRKVYSIWVCMNPPRNRQNTITAYSITESNLVGSVAEKPENYDLLTAVMICLGSPDSEGYADLLRLLDVLFSSQLDHREKLRILEEDYEIETRSKLSMEVGEMCNLSKGVMEKGRAEGRMEGRAEGRAEGRMEGRAEGRMEGRAEGRMEGRAEGRVEGRAEGLLNSLRNLMQSMKWSAEEAMNALQIPNEERSKYLAMLNET